MVLVGQLYHDAHSESGLLGRNTSTCAKVKRGKTVILAFGSIALTLVGIGYLAVQYQSHEDITRPIGLGPHDLLSRRPVSIMIKSDPEPDALFQGRQQGSRVRKLPQGESTSESELTSVPEHSGKASNPTVPSIASSLAQNTSSGEGAVPKSIIEKIISSTSPDPSRTTRYFRTKNDPPPPKTKLPKNAKDKDPVSLINEMRVNPDYTFVSCINGGNKKHYTGVIVGYEAKLVMEGWEFTAYATSKKVGKKEVAIEACNHFWDLDFKIPENEGSDIVKETCDEMRQRATASPSDV